MARMPPTDAAPGGGAPDLPGPSGDPLAVRALRALAGTRSTLATAESLTGGALAATLVSVPGASTVYVGGVVAYATRLKVALLGVPADLVEAHGVVSEPCARAMAEGARARLDADVALSTTGVAGPDSQDGRPPGTVFVGCATRDGTVVRALRIDNDRAEVRAQTVSAALSLLLDTVSSGPDDPPQVGSGR